MHGLVDQSENFTVSVPGVNVRYVDYGGVDGVTYVDTMHFIGLWNTTVDILTRLGWTVGTPSSVLSMNVEWRVG